MPTITSVNAREILDSRGNPTLETTLTLSDGSIGMAAVPSGASTGIHEALELRDKDAKRFRGLGVLKAQQNVNEEIAKAIHDKEYSQAELDNALIILDGTPNKGRFGANAMLSVSMAFAKASAISQGKELYEYLGVLGGTKEFKLPLPMLNIINGGKHADSGLDIQEYLLAPVELPTFHEKIRAGSEIVHALQDILKKENLSTSVGDEGGFAPHLSSNEQALDLLVQAIEQAGYTTDQVKIGMDAAASSFYEPGSYHLKVNGQPQQLSSAELIDWYAGLVDKYPLMLIEDGLAEDDWEGFTHMTKQLGQKITVVGDDLLVTNVERVQEAIAKQAVNSVLIKLNQIGTLTETMATITLTKQQGWTPFVSHRSGETTDTFIADLAVGLGCPLIKSGSLQRGERVAKYNRLMEIEQCI